MKKIFALTFLFSIFCLAGTDLPKDSIYQIRSFWKNQQNNSVDLKSLQGSKVILSMVYTSCPHTCPMTISKLQEIEKKIKGSLGDNYKIVLASFDTVKDRPEHLASYMKKRSLDEKIWSMLTADKDDTVRELAIVLGISYKKLEDGEFSHSNVVVLLDEQGRVISRLNSLSQNTDEFIKQALAKNGK